ncbi:hypothetical protein [Marinobacterium lutimaris]|uniref:Uncharacterized protein n=1 Tax=Marinobacterium lutimaris TaxID=568106 RepID=A0A1H6DHK0_9GAMM|nr:hypothetical protein [Marinobacterium lutimaris]SEG84273.1 hypothetical protein SAMN05444390_106107 [Marinobacterium lutimaris]
MKKFTLHLDAAIVIALVVALSLGLNAFQYFQVKSLTEENAQLKIQGVLDKLNLDSQKGFIERQNAKIEELEAAESAQAAD